MQYLHAFNECWLILALPIYICTYIFIYLSLTFPKELHCCFYLIFFWLWNCCDEDGWRCFKCKITWPRNEILFVKYFLLVYLCMWYICTAVISGCDVYWIKESNKNVWVHNVPVISEIKVLMKLRLFSFLTLNYQDFVVNLIHPFVEFISQWMKWYTYL